MENTGFYCIKCNSIPLVQIVLKEEDIKLFCMCKCNKKLINYDIFIKNYYRTNFDYSKISNEPIYKEYIDKNPRYGHDNSNEINLEKINADFKYILEKVNEFNLEIKNNMIELLQNKINEIERLYKQNKSNNIKLENLIKILISNYKSNDKNASNIKNLLNNKNFNMGYKNDTYSKLNFNNYDKYLTLDALVKNTSDYLKNNYILSSFNEQIYTIVKYYNHMKEVTCVTEMAPEIIASCSKDNYIILYSIEKKRNIYKYKAHDDGVNWIININKNNLISCGGDCLIKVWPKIDKKNLELMNNEKTTVSSIVELNINPISIFNIKENLFKLVVIDNNYLCGGSSDSNLYLIKYEIMKQNSYDKNIESNENENDILGINFTISDKLNLDKVFDLYLFEVQNKENNLIVGYGYSNLYFISLPGLKLISQIQILSDEKSLNCITQINEDELLISSRYYIVLINIHKFEIKLKIKKTSNVSFLKKLKDNTILMGTKYGIKRINLKYLEEISLINKSYPINSSYEIFNYVYEFSDGRFAICSSHGNLTICKFKIA